MDRASLLQQQRRPHTRDDLLTIALHYHELMEQEEDSATRHHLARIEQSYLVLAKSAELLAAGGTRP